MTRVLTILIMILLVCGSALGLQVRIIGSRQGERGKDARRQVRYPLKKIIRTEVNRIIVENIEVDKKKLRVHTRLIDLELEDLDGPSIAIQIEDEFDITIPDEDMERLMVEPLQALYDFVEQRVIEKQQNPVKTPMLF